MTAMLELVAILAPFGGVAYASVRWGAEQRSGLGKRRRARGGERWAIR